MIEDIDIEVEFGLHTGYGYMCIYDMELRTIKWSRRRELDPHERFLSLNAYKQYVARATGEPAERERKS